MTVPLKRVMTVLGLAATVLAASATTALAAPAREGDGPTASKGAGTAAKVDVRSADEVRAMAKSGRGTLITVKAPARATAASWLPDIYCYLDVSDPYGGTTWSEPVGASGLLVCSDFVDYITLRVELYRGDTLVKYHQVTWPLIAGLQIDIATTGCTPGSYLAIAVGEVIAFNYNPPIVSGVVGSGRKDITCGGANVPPICQVNPAACARPDLGTPAGVAGRRTD